MQGSQLKKIAVKTPIPNLRRTYKSNGWRLNGPKGRPATSQNTTGKTKAISPFEGLAETTVASQIRKYIAASLNTTKKMQEL